VLTCRNYGAFVASLAPLAGDYPHMAENACNIKHLRGARNMFRALPQLFQLVGRGAKKYSHLSGNRAPHFAP
jgi:hypothetical protein